MVEELIKGEYFLTVVEYCLDAFHARKCLPRGEPSICRGLEAPERGACSGRCGWSCTDGGRRALPRAEAEMLTR